MKIFLIEPYVYIKGMFNVRATYFGNSTPCFCHIIPKKRTVLQFPGMKVVPNVIEIAKASFTFLFYVIIRDDLGQLNMTDNAM